MTDLRDYSEDTPGNPQESYDQPPRVMVNTSYSQTIRAPGKDGKIAGYTGIDPNRGRAYITPRQYSKHYFRKLNAYAISTKIIAKLQAHNVEHIIVWDGESERSLVFQVADYARADDVPNSMQTNTPDAQKYVPKADAREIWEGQEFIPVNDLRAIGNASNGERWQ